MTVELSGHYGYRRIVKAMTPMVLMMLVTSVYSIVDGLFISNYAGSDAFAGMNLVWPAIALVGALGLMIGSGGSALVSKTFGEGDPEKANRIFSMLVRLTIVAGIAIAVLMFVFMPRVVLWLGADDALLKPAVTYGRILVSIMPFFMLQMAFQPFFMVAEKPDLGTAMSIASGVTNILLDALFVAVLGWGLPGAAVSSAIALSLGGVYPLLYFSSGRNRTHLRMVRCGFDWRSVAKSCSNGLSEFVGNIALNIIGICYNWQLMRYIGADGVSAYGIIMYMGFAFAAVFIGYNMGISQVVSYNYGAGNRAEIRSLLERSMVLIAIGGVAMVVLAELLAPTIARCFVGYDEPLCNLCVHATRIYMLSFFICGFNMFTSAWFTALNNGVVSAVAAFVRTLVFELAAVFILPAIVGIDGIWYAVNAAEILALILSATLILAYRKRYGY
ncbi:MAG: MATE family efflux transporter [Bacteroidales bacterium]|nr:MATE family efflux transporter [Bacteroidales bacterium]